MTTSFTSAERDAEVRRNHLSLHTGRWPNSIFRDGDTPYMRVTKATARRLWTEGKPIVFCPCLLYPFGGWRPSMMVQRSFETEKERAEYGLNVPTFDGLVREFESYNCTQCPGETGRYAAFYVQVQS